MMEEFAKCAVVCELNASPTLDRRYDDVGGCGGSADALCRMNGCPTSSLLSTLMKILQPPTVI